VAPAEAVVVVTSGGGGGGGSGGTSAVTTEGGGGGSSNVASASVAPPPPLSAPAAVVSPTGASTTPAPPKPAGAYDDVDGGVVGRWHPSAWLQRKCPRLTRACPCAPGSAAAVSFVLRVASALVAMMAVGLVTMIACNVIGHLAYSAVPIVSDEYGVSVAFALIFVCLLVLEAAIMMTDGAGVVIKHVAVMAPLLQHWRQYFNWSRARADQRRVARGTPMVAPAPP